VGAAAPNHWLPHPQGYPRTKTSARLTMPPKIAPITDYPLTVEMLTAMLAVTRIENESMRRALHDHLILGEPQTVAAARYGYTKQQVGVHVRMIRTKIKPAFDAYTQAVLKNR